MEKIRGIGNAKFISIALVIAVILSVTALFAIVAYNRISQFENFLAAEGNKVKVIVSDDVKKFEFGLQGARGVFLADKLSFNRDTFRLYSESRDRFSNFNGALGFGFIRAVPKKELAAYKDWVKSRVPDFVVHPEVDTDLHMIIEMIEPVEVNKPALGLDVSFEVNRRKAAEFSARSGQTALTDSIRLVQSSELKQGFLYFLPVYKTGLTPQTESERVKQLVGWAYAPIRADKLLADISTKLPPQFALTIKFDNGADEMRMGPPVHMSSWIQNYWSAELTFGGRSWLLTVLQDTHEIQIFLGLLLAVYLIFLVVAFFASARIFRFAKRRDRAITENILWLDAALNSAAHFFITTDETGRMTAVNTFAESILGYKGDELVGEPLEMILDPEEIQNRARALAESTGRQIGSGFDFFVAHCELKDSESVEWTFIAKGGKRIPVRVTMTSIKGAAEYLVGYLVVAEDLTKQNELSKVIELQRSKMVQESKMALLGEMAGGVAHEINTPLATILGTTENLKIVLENGAFEQESVLKQLNRIELTTGRIAKIVRGLRSFARNADADPMLSVEVAAIVSGVMEFCSERFKRNSVSVEFDIPQGLSITCREVQIAQILMNLLSNSFDAVKLTNEKKIWISVKKSDHEVEIFVSDSGQGIQPDVVDKIMLPFFTTKGVGEGTGLGLSVSLGIARAHGGDLRYLKGLPRTTFSLVLPIKHRTSVTTSSE